MKFKFIKISFPGLVLQSFIAITLFALLRFYFPLSTSFFIALIVALVINIFTVNYVNATVLYYQDYILVEKHFSRKPLKIHYHEIVNVTFNKRFYICTDHGKIRVPPPHKNKAEDLLKWLEIKGVKLEIKP